jgi:hypothetical protein
MNLNTDRLAEIRNELVALQPQVEMGRQQIIEALDARVPVSRELILNERVLAVRTRALREEFDLLVGA